MEVDIIMIMMKIVYNNNYYISYFNLRDNDITSKIVILMHMIT